MSMDEKHESGHGTHAPGEVGHELRDVNFRPIVWGFVGFVMLCVIAFAVAAGVLRVFSTHDAEVSPRANPLASNYGRRLPPEPRLQANPVADLDALHAAEDTVLNSYGWVDKSHNTVRIPVARAMELLAQRGLPARSEVPHEGTPDGR